MLKVAYSGPGVSRTRNLLVKSPILYQLDHCTRCELSVYLDGQRLRHECHPIYLGVTLDCTLSYREHLTKTAGKVKNRNNLLMKLAGSPGAPAPTLCGHLLSSFAIQKQSTASQSGHALLTQVRSMCS